MDGALPHIRKMRNTKFNLETYSEEPIGKPRHKWKDNMNVDLKKTRCDVVD